MPESSAGMELAVMLQNFTSPARAGKLVGAGRRTY